MCGYRSQRIFHRYESGVVKAMSMKIKSIKEFNVINTSGNSDEMKSNEIL